MIGVSKLYCGTVEASDALRYGRQAERLPSHLLQFSKDKKPVVVWNVTQACNLHCAHCYARACAVSSDTLSTEEGITLIDDLAEFGSPVILFSGGEPLMRPDILELISHAVSCGRRAVLSTNGTLLDDTKAHQLAEIGVSYVGVSLDGLRTTNDVFRGVEGAFDQAVAGIRSCQRAGVKVGLRYTITKRNVAAVPEIFDLIESEGIPRACFYHLVYSGRGDGMAEDDLGPDETRRVVDLIMDKTADFFERGLQKEILTVDNHTDGPYLYLRMLKEGNARAEDVMKLLRMNGGNSSGHGIGCVSWDGAVYPDQFWRHHPVGTVRERSFSEIWSDPDQPLLSQLRDKPGHVTGRCAECRFLDVCGGNLRARAEAVTGEVWGVDPACYLTDEEIGIA